MLLNLKKHNFSNGCLKALNDNFNDIVKDRDKTEILSLMSKERKNIITKYFSLLLIGNMMQLKSLVHCNCNKNE